MVRTACPPAETLGKYVLGSLSAAEMEGLEQHLIECQTCCDQAETLNPHDEVTQAFGLSRPGIESDHPLLDEVIQRVVRLHDAVDDTISLARTDSQHYEDAPEQLAIEAAQVLSAPQGDDELGRLGDYRCLRCSGAAGWALYSLQRI